MNLPLSIVRRAVQDVAAHSYRCSACSAAPTSTAKSCGASLWIAKAEDSRKFQSS
jgi:rRNA maturation endonuclease Nob1